MTYDNWKAENHEDKNVDPREIEEDENPEPCDGCPEQDNCDGCKAYDDWEKLEKMRQEDEDRVYNLLEHSKRR